MRRHRGRLSWLTLLLIAAIFISPFVSIKAMRSFIFWGDARVLAYFLSQGHHFFSFTPNSQTLETASKIDLGGWKPRRQIFAADWEFPIKRGDISFRFEKGSLPKNWRFYGMRSLIIKQEILMGESRFLWAHLFMPVPPFSPEKFSSLALKILYNKSFEPTARCKIYWRTTTENFDEKKSMSVEVPRDGRWKIVRFNLTENKYWKGHGEITMFRLDPYSLGYPGCKFEIEEIRLEQ